MNWFRVYNRVVSDVKIQTLPVELRWRWLECLCLASANTPRGTLPPARQVAFSLRIAPAEAEAVLTQLGEAGLLDRQEGVWVVHDWLAHQPPSDDAAFRKRNQREREKNAQKAAQEPPRKRGRPTTVKPDQGVTSTETDLGHVTGHVTGQGSDVSRNCPVREERRLEEIRKEIPPPTPRDGGDGRAGDEPFAGTDPDYRPAPDPAPAVANDPAEIERAAALAHERFGAWTAEARRACRDFPAAWVIEAIGSLTKTPGSWEYVGRILARYRRQGGSDNELRDRAAPNGQPARAAPAEAPAPRLPANDPAEVEATRRKREAALAAHRARAGGA